MDNLDRDIQNDNTVGDLTIRNAKELLINDLKKFKEVYDIKDEIINEFKEKINSVFTQDDNNLLKNINEDGKNNLFGGETEETIVINRVKLKIDINNISRLKLKLRDQLYLKTLSQEMLEKNFIFNSEKLESHIEYFSQKTLWECVKEGDGNDEKLNWEEITTDRDSKLRNYHTRFTEQYDHKDEWSDYEYFKQNYITEPEFIKIFESKQSQGSEGKSSEEKNTKITDAVNKFKFHFNGVDTFKKQKQHIITIEVLAHICII